MPLLPGGAEERSLESKNHYGAERINEHEPPLFPLRSKAPDKLPGGFALLHAVLRRSVISTFGILDVW